ncbi:MAG: ATP-binding protein [Anaerolineae bacterium]|nr:ATP-binding protein [Anaerolineae bacterium]
MELKKRLVALVGSFWPLQGLQAKILWPILGLMAVSLLVSIGAFVGGTVLTRNQILEQRLEQDAGRVVQVLTSRAGMVQASAKMMAAHGEVRWALQQKTEANLAQVDSQAVILRNRFDLDLIQIYDAQGNAWVNLVTAELFQISSLLPEAREDSVRLMVANDRLLLIGSARTAEGGTIITGIDLGSELKRIARREALSAVIALRWRGTDISTEPSLSFAALEHSSDHYTRRLSLSLAGEEVVLLLGHSTAAINRVMQTGLGMVVLASVLTTGLLVFLAGRLVQSLLRPLGDLARASQRVAIEHDFTALDAYVPCGGFLCIGQNDEIGQLEASFRQMLAELESLYRDLEGKVRERTQQIVIAAEIARATMSTLELDQVLQTAVEQIRRQFGYYFVGVFILDMEREEVVLRQASGAVAEIPSITIPLNQKSLITTAVRLREPVVVQDVRESSLYLFLPELPDTLSEAVFPLMYAGTVIGALDIQSAERNAFSPEMVETLTTLASQVAIAVQNALVYRRQQELTNRLAELDHLKMQLLNTINHELRTPLNTIIGFSQLLLKGVDGELNEAQRASLNAINRQGRHLLEMVERIMEISQLEAGRVMLDLQPTDLYQEIQRAADEVQKELLEKKSVRLEIDLPPDLPPVMADARRIRQALYQLLSNAVKFTPQGRIAIRAAHSSQWVVISVEDTGIGISPEDMEKLFQPFSQADLSSARKFGGLGLGLSLARYIIELHGGQIWAESQPGSGSTFSFTLPLNPSIPRVTPQMMEVSRFLQRE